MKRRSFAKSIAAAAAAAAIPKTSTSQTLNTGSAKVTILVGKNGTCASQMPAHAQLRTRHTRVIELAADSANTVPVTITYSQDPAELFDYYPQAPFTLRPGATPEVFVIKRDLGLEARGTFVNDDPRYARIFRYQHNPSLHCSDGQHEDWHFEC